MSIEDEFDIRISDETATTMSTIGNAIGVVVAELRKRPGEAGVCATAGSFYRLRQKPIARFDAHREGIRLAAPIGTLVAPRRRKHWNEVAMETGLRTELFKTRFPPPEMTLGDVLRTRCNSTYWRFDGSLDEAAVAQRIIRLTAEQAGVPPEKLGRDTRFVNDLHLE